MVNGVDQFMLFFFLFQPVLYSDREVLARLRNCIVGMAEHRMMLYDTSILYTYEASLKYTVRIFTLLVFFFFHFIGDYFGTRQTPTKGYKHRAGNSRSLSLV